MDLKKFSWFSVFLSTGTAVPITWAITWCLGALDWEMLLAELGTCFLTCVIMERLWPTVTREDKAQ